MLETSRLAKLEKEEELLQIRLESFEKRLGPRKCGMPGSNLEEKLGPKAKLTELGFLGETTSTEEKVSTTNEGNTVEQLKTLTKLYESGNLTKEEFDAAKKKVLND